MILKSEQGAVAPSRMAGRLATELPRTPRTDGMGGDRVARLRQVVLCTTSLVAFGLLAATTTPSRADDAWTGTTSTDWFTASNWSTGAVPTSGDTAVLDTVTPNATVVGAAGAQPFALIVGFSGTGALTIQNGGTVSNNGTGAIGLAFGSTGTVTVDGAGSSWAHSGNLFVGDSGTGTLTIRNGGAVSSGTGAIGFASGSTGTVTVDGAGSSWANSANLYVGYQGTGTLTIRNGGTVSNGFGYIGYNSGSTGTVTVDGAGSSWANSSDLVVGYFGTGTLTIRNGGTVSNGFGYIGYNSGSTGTVTVDGAGSSWTISSDLVVGDFGTGTLTIRNGGSVTAPSVTIATFAGSTGTLNIGAALGQTAVAPGTLNTATVAFGGGTGEIVFNHTASNYTFDPLISGAGSVLVEAGRTILTATNTYTGPTTVDGGILSVNGSIASSSLTTVNAGGTLGGNGFVGATFINGGTLAPGNSIGLLTVQGSLTFTAAATYLVEVSPANADRTNVKGTATLGGATVNAVFASGTYVNKQYTILNATGGVSGTFSLVNTNLPANFVSSLSYDANDVYLNLTLNFSPSSFGTGLTTNQQNVANTLSSFFNASGGIPLAFGALTPAGLTQISGETATGSQQATFDAMGMFMGVMTDPFIAGRGDPISAGGRPNAYADESLAYAAKRKPNDALAAIYTKAPPVPVFEQRWSVWAAGYGGSQRTDGNAVLGSNDTRSSIYGMAVGADYRISPNTLAGFALGGGGTNFSVNGFGSGRSDLFQAGAFLRHNIGPAYLTGALAYGWQDITTDRTVTVAGIDRLRAQFNANAWSGRLEGGYRFVSQGFGWTPYAAAQFVTFELPNYAEQAIVGSNQFALAYNSKSVTDTRSELGLRSDKSFAVQEDGIFTLRGRAAWAHDYNPDRVIGATFQTLPGASFVVNGARRAADSALVTGSAEMKWLNGWSIAGTFEGEFSNVTQSYAGKGVVRYAW
ncbi:autotransporter domain-containing protein [Bradyrhizobium sp. CCGUVB1N3]|uniref:autotransporter outer membrane beta-barrel domain-containing protein n=1 Tax=Bradyrhizobium sp. CCGUVB1N3 TaxID=2949629 RepID=UPI0020B39AD6|nr:autotransporter domain-containing protein [Bradyrhizobium sp. CCGUVB1N3]MCP3470142.1 autotransporter domain-containing protein [Bradyrhizobium sp. CCGUVB1N3]